MHVILFQYCSKVKGDFEVRWSSMLFRLPHSILSTVTPEVAETIYVSHALQTFVVGIPNLILSAIFICLKFDTIFSPGALTPCERSANVTCTIGEDFVRPPVVHVCIAGYFIVACTSAIITISRLLLYRRKGGPWGGQAKEGGGLERPSKTEATPLVKEAV